jgi:hypothetical protein
MEIWTAIMVVTLMLAFAVGVIRRRIAGLNSRDVATAPKFRRAW